LSITKCGCRGAGSQNSTFGGG